MEQFNEYNAIALGAILYNRTLPLCIAWVVHHLRDIGLLGYHLLLRVVTAGLTDEWTPNGQMGAKPNNELKRHATSQQ